MPSSYLVLLPNSYTYCRGRIYSHSHVWLVDVQEVYAFNQSDIHICHMRIPVLHTKFVNDTNYCTLICLDSLCVLI